MKPTGLLIFILVGVSALVGLLFTWPAYQDMRLMRSDIQKRRQEYETREAYYTTLREAKSRLQERAAEIARLDAAIPNEQGLPALYGMLQAMASESGLAVRSVNSSPVGQSVPDVRARQITIDLKLTGTYASFKTFLERIKTAPRFLNVQEVAFSSSRSTTIPFDFSLLLNAYSY